jgi:hypothetical protein
MNAHFGDGSVHSISFRVNLTVFNYPGDRSGGLGYGSSNFLLESVAG